MANVAGSPELRWRDILHVVLVAVLVQNFGPSLLPAQTVVDRKSEYNVKAVYLYSFGRYVSWPEDAFESKQSAFVIGVLGENPFGTALQRIARTKKIQGRSIDLRLIARGDDLAGCHILFIPNTVSLGQRDKTLAHMLGQPVLIVGEQHGFAQKGGIVCFAIEKNTVRFRINVEAAKAHRLSIDGKLLSLAEIVGTAK